MAAPVAEGMNDAVSMTTSPYVFMCLIRCAQGQTLHVLTVHLKQQLNKQ
jgi:hypothetical protein